MLARLKNWLIKQLAPPNKGTTDCKVPAVTPHLKALGIDSKAWARLAAVMENESETPRFKEYGAPHLPPGVLPLVAFDALPGEAKRRGMAFDDGGTIAPAYTWLNGFNNVGQGLGFPGYPYLSELTQISEYRSPAETISTEMTRKWCEILSRGEGDKSDKIKEINKRMDELKVRDAFRRAAMQDAEFGRSQIILNIKGQDSELARQKPLMISDNGGIKQGTLCSIQVIEPYWSTPYSWNATHPEKEDFYIPQSWYIMGRKTHTSRLLTFISREVPDLLKPAYNFGGISLSQLMEPYVNAWLRTRKSVNDLISIFSITTLATDLSTTLADGLSDVGGMVSRATAFTKFRDNRGVSLINKETEEIAQVNTPLSGLDKLQAQSQEHMAAPCHIPLVKLFGVVPTGLNATSEGEIQVWYDYVHALQENVFGPQMVIMLNAVQLDLFGSIDEDIYAQWVQLDEPTAKELSEIRASDATAGAGYIAAGVIAPEEERERLQNDPLSGYDNLNGPAPEPQVEDDGTGLAEQGQEHEAGQADADREHASGEADKDREHEANENDKDRKHAIALEKAKPKPKPPAKG